MEQFFRLLEDSRFIMSEDQRAKFQQSLRRYVIPKGRILVDLGQISPNLYFVEKGVMRTYYLRGSDDITSLLVSEGEIVCIAESFFLQEPSKEVLETLEDTTVFAISYNEYRGLVEQDHNMTKLAVILLERHLVNFTDKVKVFKYLSVEERISYYINQPTSLFRRIPDHYIATYLGTTSATFSRCLKAIPAQRVQRTPPK